MNRNALVPSLALLVWAAPALGQEPPEVEIPEVDPLPADVSTIDGIVTAFYEVISGPAGAPRDWGRDATLYLPGITFTPATVDAGTGAPRARTVAKEAWIRAADPWLVEHGFVEREIGRSVTRFGNVAHVWSAYAWESGDGETGRGVNGLHLYWDGERWWITHATWDDERAENPIPEAWIGDGAAGGP